MSEKPRFHTNENGRLIFDSDFTYDAMFNVDGDFESDDVRIAYTAKIVDALNRRAPAQPEPAAPRFPTMLRKMWSGGEVQAWIDEHWPAAAPTVVEPLTRDVVAEIVRNHLTATYHCTRVWAAWSVGTMTEDDFELASESDMAEEIADAILAATPPRAALTDECLSLLDTAMDSLKYHQEQTRPIHLTQVTIQAIQEFLEKHQIGGPRNE